MPLCLDQNPYLCVITTIIKNKMRKVFYLLSFLVWLCPAICMAQGLHLGLKAGILGNKADIHGISNWVKTENMTGFQVGPMLQYQTGFYGLTLDFSNFKCRINIIEYKTAYSAMKPFTISVRCSTFYHYNNTTNQCLSNLLPRTGIYSTKSRT